MLVLRDNTNYGLIILSELTDVDIFSHSNMNSCNDYVPTRGLQLVRTARTETAFRGNFLLPFTKR